jgi:hypothetical protein
MPSISFAAIAAALALAACAPAEFVPEAPMALDGASLEITPVPQAECDPGKPFSVRVAWSVIDWPDPKFDFRLGSSKGQLWARVNQAKGEQTSDPWAVPGQWFVMLDRNSGVVVAASPVPPLECPAG